jgi:hypothetical protein
MQGWRLRWEWGRSKGRKAKIRTSPYFKICISEVLWRTELSLFPLGTMPISDFSAFLVDFWLPRILTKTCRKKVSREHLSELQRSWIPMQYMFLMFYTWVNCIFIVPCLSNMRLTSNFIGIFIILFHEYQMYSHSLTMCHARLKNNSGIQQSI